ncbi:MAG: hypothetical protein IKU84_00555 [Clostridia bacterium]|nr:hypothetical protein [Clostridia bacterium]
MSTENNEKKPSRNFFIFYCVVLFLFAGILITFSYISQERVEQQLVDTTEKAEGFASRLEQANAKNAEFETTIVEQKKQIDTLTAQVTASTAKLTEQEKKLAASDYLWKLVKASYLKKYGDCRSIIAMIDSNDLRKYLDEDGLAELKRIEKNTKG